MKVIQEKLGKLEEDCVVFLGKTLYSHAASLQPGAQMGMLGVTLQWTSIPSRGSRNTPGHFMLQKPEIHVRANLMGPLACMQTSPPYLMLRTCIILLWALISVFSYFVNLLN